METTWYICKYTPVELLEALGGRCQVLDYMPEDFGLSDQVSHPNLCGFGKACIQACLEGKVRELVLVNCCDTIRGAYDVLLSHGKLDFLFLMDRLHCGDACAREKTKGASCPLPEAWEDEAEEDGPPWTLGAQADRATAAVSTRAAQGTRRLFMGTSYLGQTADAQSRAGALRPAGQSHYIRRKWSYHHKINANQQQIGDKSPGFLKNTLRLP